MHPPTTAVLVCQSADLEVLTQLADQATQYAADSSALNTRRAYRSDWSHFERWCAGVGAEALPASPSTLALYLTAFAPSHSVSTLARRLASIRSVHRRADLSPPNSSALHAVWTGIRRRHGRPPEGKRPLLTQDLRLAIGKLPDTLRGKRDRALLLLGFAAALRRSELSAVEFEGALGGNVTFRLVPQGLELHVHRSKGDQTGDGAIIAVPFGSHPETCPVAAVQDWCDSAELVAGPLFRKVSRAGCVGRDALGPQTVANVVKAAAASIGFDDRAFAGHSLRSGLATSAAANDAPALVIQRHLRHAQGDTTARYIRAANRFIDSAGAFAGL